MAPAFRRWPQRRRPLLRIIWPFVAVVVVLLALLGSARSDK
jgi:hypothetical protein